MLSIARELLSDRPGCARCNINLYTFAIRNKLYRIFHIQRAACQEQSLTSACSYWSDDGGLRNGVRNPFRKQMPQLQKGFVMFKNRPMLAVLVFVSLGGGVAFAQE